MNPYGEYKADRIVEYDVVIKRLDDLVCCSVEKYFDRQGRVRWRSLDVYRNVFRSGHEGREVCAQEVVRECSSVRARMRGRARIMAERLAGEQP